ncbi:type-1 angiotensin II receptor B-like [Saccostrea echinata]|uniref:type-1 angiotensin II receptor B-like n=1 Tax=Saccostrea echinata TaxID=191078 RepID=UPI002A82F3F4|nr:type-1 angiotensin II receptor B-like [Saccostrea echinata]
MEYATYYARFSWFPKDHQIYLNLIPAILQLMLVVTNLFILVVFFRRKWFGGVNLILIGMALSDMASVVLLLVSYLFALTLHIHSVDPQSEFQIHFLCITYKYGTNLSITFNMTSIWLMMFLGIVKFILVRFPLKAKLYTTSRRLLMGTMTIYLITLLYNVPRYLTDNYDIAAKLYPRKLKETGSFYCAIKSIKDKNFQMFLQRDDLLIRSICVHVIPVVVLLCTSTYFCYKLSKRSYDFSPTPASKRSVKIVTALTIVHLISEIPFSVFFCLQYYMVVTKQPLNFILENGYQLIFALYVLRFMNYLSNFWVYILFNKKFRDTCRSFFCRCRSQAII